MQLLMRSSLSRDVLKLKSIMDLMIIHLVTLSTKEGLYIGSHDEDKMVHCYRNNYNREDNRLQILGRFRRFSRFYIQKVSI